MLKCDTAGGAASEWDDSRPRVRTAPPLTLPGMSPLRPFSCCCCFEAEPGNEETLVTGEPCRLTPERLPGGVERSRQLPSALSAASAFS